MNYNNWLICGTRRKGYKEKVFQELDKLMTEHNRPESIIEGCCPDSADVYAEDWAMKKGIRIQHHPSAPGNYLKRNIEMVGKADLVICFWDFFSYGTAHTLAHAAMQNKKIVVIPIK
jgi:hypothetical protein